MHKARAMTVHHPEPMPADRFAGYPQLRARVVLAIIGVFVVLAALVPIRAAKQDIQPAGFVEAVAGGSERPAAKRPRDHDLALYDRVIGRIARGENYYQAAALEHRAANYPLRPGVAVRLPTLAYLNLWLGDRGTGDTDLIWGEVLAAIALMLAVIWAWWRRLGDEPGGLRFRLLGTALVFVGASLGLNRYYFVLHELWAGMLIALALGLHRPGRKWLGAVLAAGLALAIREHALPFVLLMAATALYRRDWREAAAWGGVAALFAIGLTLHLQQVAQVVLPSDVIGPDWLVFRGLPGWLSNVVLSSNLRFLAHYIAGPLVILMMAGWAGWNSPLGTTATLLFLGYGLAFMIAGRPDNFYWGAVIAPAMFAGLAFAPRALASLVRAAR